MTETIDPEVAPRIAVLDWPAIAASLAQLFAERGQWDGRRAVARAFVERERNWSSNILRYEPVYQRLLDLPIRARAAA